MKKLIVIFLVLLYSCNSTVNFDFPEPEKIIYCTCLFSTDKHWSVKVGYTYGFNEYEKETIINNAEVCIIDNHQDTIKLEYSDNGEYCSKIEKPEEGKEYKLLVISGGDTVSSSYSAVPSGAEVSFTELDESPGTVQYKFYSIDEVYDIKCSIRMDENKKQGLMVRSFIFDTVRGVDCYVFDELFYDTVKNVINDSGIFEKLLLFKGDTIYRYENIYSILSGYFNDDISEDLRQQTISLSYRGKTYKRNDETLNKIISFPGSVNFESFDYENYTLLGNFYETSDFSVYVWDFLEGEYWMEFTLLSKEAYDFYSDYITQISGRADYSNYQTPVYSNIKNGTGIFAGVKRKYEKIR
jgi:hypothetical protein